MRFYNFDQFFFKKEQQRNHYWKDSSRNDGFYNTFAACTGTMKTLLPVDENRHFFAITMGRMKPETRADEGSERCCCCCFRSFSSSSSSSSSCPSRALLSYQFLKLSHRT